MKTPETSHEIIDELTDRYGTNESNIVYIHVNSRDYEIVTLTVPYVDVRKIMYELYDNVSYGFCLPRLDSGFLAHDTKKQLELIEYVKWSEVFRILTDSKGYETTNFYDQIVYYCHKSTAKSLRDVLIESEIMSCDRKVKNATDAMDTYQVMRDGWIEAEAEVKKGIQ